MGEDRPHETELVATINRFDGLQLCRSFPDWRDEDEDSSPSMPWLFPFLCCVFPLSRCSGERVLELKTL